MHPAQKGVRNGGLPPSSLPTAMGNLEKSLSFQGGRHQQTHRNRLPPPSSNETTTVAYSHPYKRQHHQVNSSSVSNRQQPQRKLLNGDLKKPPKDYHHRHGNGALNVPEPDYSQTDTGSDDGSVRLRNQSYWANSSEYYNRGPEDNERRGAANHGNLAPTIQRKRTTFPNHRWHADIESSIAAPTDRQMDYSHKQTLPLRKPTRGIIDDDHHPHVTTITLTDSGDSYGKLNGGGSLHRGDKTSTDHTRRSNLRVDSDHANQDIASSAHLDSVFPNTFSNVNLLKRVNDRYKLTERLIIQLKIIAVLHTFFGFAMFSLDTSQTIVLWPHVVDSADKLSLSLRLLYSLGVVLIACLSIAIACGKRSVFFLEIVKLLCLVFLAMLLVAPTQTPFFKSITDSLEYNDALRRHHDITRALGEQIDRRRFDRPEPTAPPAIAPNLSPPTTTHVPVRTLSDWKRRNGETTKRSSPNDRPPRPPSSNEIIDDIRQIEFARLPIDDAQRAAIEFPNSTNDDREQQRSRALRIAQHLRIAFAIFACCHYLLTAATLAIVFRLERLT